MSEIPHLDCGQAAFFFDFDGVLAPIVDDPLGVSVSPIIRQGLRDIHNRAGGAVAIISGRELAQIDRFLAPLELPAAGIHGAERRRPDGRFEHDEIDAAILKHAGERVMAFTSRHEGTLAETKNASVAVHFRKRPDLEAAAQEFMRDLVAELGHGKLVSGKMVVELKFSDRTKGDAILHFMEADPFSGRRPVFFGDDITDEDGFQIVNSMDGISVKVGSGETRARYRLDDTSAVESWFTTVCRHPRGEASHNNLGRAS
ncbi:trehalose-phosphatase [Oricola cellulosilytica]|nr:trehalose-phosphatase [Oricola cellulosilytica]